MAEIRFFIVNNLYRPTQHTHAAKTVKFGPGNPQKKPERILMKRPDRRRRSARRRKRKQDSSHTRIWYEVTFSITRTNVLSSTWTMRIFLIARAAASTGMIIVSPEFAQALSSGMMPWSLAPQDHQPDATRACHPKHRMVAQQGWPQTRS